MFHRVVVGVQNLEPFFLCIRHARLLSRGRVAPECVGGTPETPEQARPEGWGSPGAPPLSGALISRATRGAPSAQKELQAPPWQVTSSLPDDTLGIEIPAFGDQWLNSHMGLVAWKSDFLNMWTWWELHRRPQAQSVCEQLQGARAQVTSLNRSGPQAHEKSNSFGPGLPGEACVTKALPPEEHSCVLGKRNLNFWNANDRYRKHYMISNFKVYLIKY